MRSNTFVYAKRRKPRDRKAIIISLIILVMILGAARMDCVIQRDCNGNQACLDAVMP